MSQQITLYTAKICPYAHRAEIALQESGLPYERYEIDLKNKPDWYALKVNPASKVPALSYGGPKAPPEDPSPESHKLAESLVLLEFIADISNSLLPKDPVLRAKARFFIDAVSTKLVPLWYATAFRGESAEGLLTGIEVVQALLPPEGYAVGEYSIADAAITPFLARAEVCFKNDLGAYDEGTGKKVWGILQADPKFERFHKYFGDIKARKSFQVTFDSDYILNQFMPRLSEARAKRVQAKA